MQKRKSLFISVLATLIAVCLALGIFFTFQQERAEAASPTDPANKIVEDIVDDSGNPIRDNFKDLLQKLGGNWQDILTMTEGTQTAKNGALPNDLPKALTAADIRQKAMVGTGELIVKFGGKAFNPMYLTRDNNGNVILDLWLSESTKELKFAYFSNSSSALAYPSNMYGSSYVRAYLVGTDQAKYSKNGTALDGTTLDVADSASDWADFNKSTSKFGKWLVAPKDVKYQEVQSVVYAFVNYNSGVVCPSDAYGTPYNNKTYNSGGVNSDYGGTNQKDKYDDWKNDLIWIPSYTEIGKTDTTSVKPFSGIWYPDANQFKSSTTTKNTWYRSGQAAFPQNVMSFTSAGHGEGTATTTVCAVRPALHLNLSAIVEKLNILQLTSDASSNAITKPYDGIESVIKLTGYNAAKMTYSITDEPFGTNGGTASFDQTTGDFKATKAGTYTLKVTLNSDCEFADISADNKVFKITIEPETIKVNFDDVGTDENKKQKRKYTYHESTDHEIKLSEDIIQLVASDTNKGSMKIYYKMIEHDESMMDSATHDSIVFANPPDISQITDTTPPTAKNPGGYCVWFKIVADNHETYYGSDGAGAGSYISVHIYTEILNIKVEDGDLGEYEYGDIDTPEYENLGKLLQEEDGSPKYTIEYPDDSQVKDTLDGDKINFYLKDGEGEVAKKVNGRYPVGEYTLAAEWKDPGNKHYVDFTLNGGTPPQVKIVPKKAAVSWKGEDDSDTDFEWEYDGNPHAPTAYFTDLDGAEHKLPTIADYILTDVGDESAKIDAAACKAAYPDYDFSDAAVQPYKIVPTPNSWEKESFKVPDWATCGDPPAISSLPRAKYGTVVIKYYSDSDCTAEATLVKGMTPGTYYARAEVAAEDNFGGIIGTPVSFTVKDHTYVLVPKDENGHYGRCSVCGTETATTGHSFTQHIKNATCTEDGYTSEDCECGFSKIDESTREKARGHNMSNHYPAKQATATTDGNIEYFECGVCHKYFKDIQGNEEVAIENTVIPATGAITPPEGSSGDDEGGSGTGDNTGGSGSGGQSGNTGESGSGDGTGDGGSGSGSGAGGSGESGGNQNNNGDESSVNPPLGGDTGLNGSGVNDFFKENWWWMLAIAVFVLLVIILLIVWSVIRSRRRDKQIDTLLKMQMVHSYGGYAPYQGAAAADDNEAALDGQQAPAQLPFNQEMFDAAVAAAVKSALTAINSGEIPAGGASAENVDVDGFYDDVEEEPEDPTGNEQ